MGNSLVKNFNKQNGSTAIIFMLYAVVTIALYTLPMLKVTLPYMLVAVVLLGSMFFFMYRNVRWLYFILILVITSIIVMAINVMTGVYGLVESINEMIRNIRFFLPVLWGCYAIKGTNDKQKKFVLIAFGVLCGFILIKTLGALRIDPMVCRDLAAGASDNSTSRLASRMQNVGGFDFSYMMGIVTLCFVWSAIRGKNKRYRIVSIVAAVIGYYFIIQSMYTLLLILTFIGTVMILFISTKSTFLKVCIALTCIAVVFFIEPILKFLADFFSFSYMFNQKFMNMYLALKYDDVGIVGSRPDLLKTAFLNWTENPILGGKHTNSNCHSLIMTILENSGIIGAGLWVGFFINGWKMLKEEMAIKNIQTALVDVVMIYVLLLSFFNPIGYVFEVLFAAYFIVPIWSAVTNAHTQARISRRKHSV